MMFPALERIVKNLKPKYDDDAIDRLNYAYTTSFLSLLIVIIGTKQYIGEPLQCWMKPEFKGSWEKYIENYCFVENTYYWPLTEPKLPPLQERKQYELTYYQWVPLMLIGQLLLFLFPKTLWTAFSWKTGFSMRAVTHGMMNEKHNRILRHYKKNDSHEETRNIAAHIQSVQEYNRARDDEMFGFLPSSFYSAYTTTVYLLFKFLNCVNVMLQLFILNQFLNTSYTFWGIGLLQDLVNGMDWKVSGHFPRVTYCDFMRRDDTSSKPSSVNVQCVLMLNMFNEKIYIVLWFWLTILTFINIGNFLFWLITSFSSSYKSAFIRSQMAFAGYDDGEQANSKSMADFVRGLPTDTITILRLTSSNTGDLIASDVIGELWKLFDVVNVQKKTQETRQKEREDAQEGFQNHVNEMYADDEPGQGFGFGYRRGDQPFVYFQAFSPAGSMPRQPAPSSQYEKPRFVEVFGDENEPPRDTPEFHHSHPGTPPSQEFEVIDESSH